MPTKTLPLLEVKLPAGRVSGVDVMLDNGDQRRRKLVVPAGYGGVRLIGAGRYLTHVMVDDDYYHDAAVNVGPFAGVVQLESLSVHGGGRSAVHFGTMGSGRYKGMTLRARDVAFVADPRSPSHGSTRWGYRTYQCDVDLEDCEFYWYEAVEHCGYADHFATARGVRWRRVTVHGSGAECLKVRCPPSDGVWTKNALVWLKECTLKAWHNPATSWRGGAGVVLQGSGAHLLIEDSQLWGRAGTAFMRCVMVDNGGGAFYSADDGRKGGRFANGHVVIRRSALYGGPGPDWYSPTLRVGPDGSDHLTAMSVTVEDSGLYGDHSCVQLSSVPAGKINVRGCNTPAIRELMTARGFATEHETAVVSFPIVKLSQGYVA